MGRVTQGSATRPVPMPKATTCLICQECGNTITEVDLSTNFLAAVLFRARKDHAKIVHHWEARP
jgi:hypothetical protein